MNEDDEAQAVMLGLAMLGAPIHIRSIQTYLTHADLAVHPWV